MRHAMVDLARDAMEANKPVAAICHGPQLLISAIARRAPHADLLAVDRHRRDERRLASTSTSRWSRTAT